MLTKLYRCFPDALYYQLNSYSSLNVRGQFPLGHVGFRQCLLAFDKNVAFVLGLIVQAVDFLIKFAPAHCCHAQHIIAQKLKHILFFALHFFVVLPSI